MSTHVNRYRAFSAVMGMAALMTLLVFSTGAGANEPWVVHEWGTFTSLQDDSGRELSGINIDDEPVPEFVHNLSPFLLGNAFVSKPHWQYRQKGTPRQHPLVTMRLETPVIYFYPPASDVPLPIDVSVQFRGGWLTEFYPRGEVSAPGLETGLFNFGELTPQTVGSLAWRHLLVGTAGTGPQTDSPVWLAPRNVAAANVTAASGESEKYLFYRGVGNLRAPLRVTTDRQAGALQIHANFDEVLSSGESAWIPALWLVHIRADGSSAYRELKGCEVSSDPREVLATTSGRFDSQHYTSDNLARLYGAMHQALVADGLYADEAEALLATWQRAYFTTPGLRLFFLVPRRWTDHYLPLSLSRTADLQRVMVGRIELVTQEQRDLLACLAGGEVSDASWIEQLPETENRDKFLAGRSDFGDLGVPIPPDYRAYLALGRFRNALVVAEEHFRPTPSLTKFINAYGLEPYRWKK